MADDRRFPGFVYEHGTEPDPRFSLANERTYLAWIRTSLALLAVGGALLAVDLPVSSSWQLLAAALFGVSASFGAVRGWTAWVRTERRLRLGEPLPGLGVGGALTLVVVAAAVLLAAGIAIGGELS